MKDRCGWTDPHFVQCILEDDHEGMCDYQPTETLRHNLLTAMRKRSEIRKASTPPSPSSERSVSERSDTEAEKKKTVEELSGQLRDHLQPPPSPFKFESANAAKYAKVRPDLEQLVEKVVVHDIQAMWKKLKEALRVGEKRSDYSTLRQALDDAETNAYNAHRTFVTAKLERDRWERENDVIWGAMWSDATRSVQGEKDAGIRSKQITDADIKARCATLHPDEYQAQEARRAQIKMVVDSLEDLANEWKSRCQSLRSLVGTLRT